MSKTIRSFILFGSPLFVGVLNLFHPVFFGHTDIYAGIRDVAGWWVTLHVLNLFGFALLGLAGYLMILERRGIDTAVAKVALVLFVPAYAGFDSVIGIGTGNLVRYANSLPLSQLPAIQAAIDAFWNNDTATMLAIMGSALWSVAMTASAVSYASSRRAAAIAVGVFGSAYTGWGYSSGMFGSLPWWIGVASIAAIGLIVVRPALPYASLILAGILFGTTHVVPFGPLGMLCFLAAAAIAQVAPQPFAAGQMDAARSQG